MARAQGTALQAVDRRAQAQPARRVRLGPQQEECAHSTWVQRNLLQESDDFYTGW